eukprot:8316584-Karenia_brevis.AAC.1
MAALNMITCWHCLRPRASTDPSCVLPPAAAATLRELWRPVRHRRGPCPPRPRKPRTAHVSLQALDPRPLRAVA